MDKDKYTKYDLIKFNNKYRVVNLNCEDLYWGLENFIVNYDDIIWYAKEILDNDNIANMLDIAISVNYEEVRLNLISNIDKDIQIKEYLKLKWLYLILSYIYHSRLSYDDEILSDILLDIYDDFEAPDEVSSIIYFSNWWNNWDRMKLEEELEEYLILNRYNYE